MNDDIDYWNPVYIDVTNYQKQTFYAHGFDFYTMRYFSPYNNTFFARGCFHNPFGPAAIRNRDGKEMYALNGSKLSESEWKWLVKHQILPRHGNDFGSNIVDVITDEKLKMEYILLFG